MDRLIEKTQEISPAIREISLYAVGMTEPTSRAAFFAQECIALTKHKLLEWSCVAPHVYVAICEGYTLCVRSEGQKKFFASVFRGRKEMLMIVSVHPRHSFGCSAPIMDLFDIISVGEKRRMPPSHVCGLQGFGLDASDRCPACEEEGRYRR